MQTKLLNSDKLLIFVNKHRTALRNTSLSQELYKFVFSKRDLTEENMYELTQRLLVAEKNATSPQKNLFKDIDKELQIPYQKAKKLSLEGKLTQESFRKLINENKEGK